MEYNMIVTILFAAGVIYYIARGETLLASVIITFLWALLIAFVLQLVANSWFVLLVLLSVGGVWFYFGKEKESEKDK